MRGLAPHCARWISVYSLAMPHRKQSNFYVAVISAVAIGFTVSCTKNGASCDVRGLALDKTSQLYSIDVEKIKVVKDEKFREDRFVSVFFRNEGDSDYAGSLLHIDPRLCKVKGFQTQEGMSSSFMPELGHDSPPPTLMPDKLN
ncbi:hypothetical protein [Novosphingobium guangzhouense]|uniref:hypothetical protein n=1 Tax=Novosphingobium guangzhouense TaxID=1850347 RepID=UPI0011AFC4A2|nr:hypothetical protein [Novosphingobium guangzhouense]